MSQRLVNIKKVAPLYGSCDSEIENPTLPKTMTHWFSEFGIYFDPESGVGWTHKRSFTAQCLNFTRKFRVLPHIGVMQICDGNFDRWANSVGAEVPLPKTRAEFCAAIEILNSSAVLNEFPVESEISSLKEQIDRVNEKIKNHFLDESWFYSACSKFGVHGKRVRRYFNVIRWRLEEMYARRRELKSELKFLQRKIH